MTAWHIWIDRGGTFTDIVARNSEGRLITRKLLSENSEHYQDAALQGIHEILSSEGGTLACVKMGTTVGTNALLERHGAKVALVTNRGFKDCLKIGYQNRPDIFALDIRRAEQLYQTVLELDVRVNVLGKVLQELDETIAYRELQILYQQGFRALAIVLMHAWRYSVHEQRLAAIAKAIGFKQISLSHQVSPLPKLISRGDTTVVDAYLSPLLQQYVQQVVTGLDQYQPRLLFMQSNGGLVEAHAFHGKDCMLSGPAGGIVGASVIAQQAGFNKIIAFDMGGTSTDVARFAGELERNFETEIAGIKIRAPMMAIHTVAAGGGSVLQFDGLRYRVGPESAGANPGPACYRRGGPLTVTDANLMLGKLPAFPAVFGEHGNLPLDADRVKYLFAELALRIEQSIGDQRSPEQVAEGFLTIAVENMANAIKKISVQKGYDLSDYALCCYGAAGAQHACKIAERLGMTTVLLHPLAGVLSAFGMGLADFRVLKEQALEQIYDSIHVAELQTCLQELEQQACSELLAQGLNDNQLISHWRLALRFQGTDSSLLIDFSDKATMLADFQQRYREQFGFCYHRPVVISSVVVECIGTETHTTTNLLTDHQADGKIAFDTRMFSNNAWHDTPVYQRDNLLVKQVITGTAIIIEPISTIVIEPNWQAELQADGNLILSRLSTTEQSTVSTTADPVQLEIFNKLFMSIAEQMGFVLQNTAHSVNIKERLDFSCAIFDKMGQLIANAPHIPVHLGSMGESVKALLHNIQDLQTGDVYLLNSPYAGGTHLPDITVVTPVFSEAGELLFFTGSRGHHADIGGIAPGSMPAHSHHIAEEGVISDGLKIVSQGQFQETALRAWLQPARNIEQNIADLQAQIAANQTGAKELLAMVARYSLPVVQAYMQFVQDNAEAAVRNVLKNLHNGSFTYTLDQGASIVVNISIDNEQGAARIDFSGTSAQLSDNFNAPLAVCKAAVLYVFRTLVHDDIPLNAGCLKPLELVIPEGTLLNPSYPAAVVAGNVETSQYIVDALYGALGVLAASQGTMNNLTFGTEDYQYYETICGGAGAGNGFDGASAIHTHMTNSRMTDPEILEARFPVLLEEFSIREGSGGLGRYRGGDGVIRRLQFLQAMKVSILSSHRLYPPFGLQGGSAGQLGSNRLIYADGAVNTLAANISLTVQAGDSIEIVTPGGGGFGEC